MSNHYLTQVLLHSEAKGPARLVLLVLADMADDSGKCWPSISTIAHRSRITERQVMRLIGRLVDDGHIAKTTSPGRSSTYQVLTPVKSDTPEASDTPVKNDTPDTKMALVSMTTPDGIDTPVIFDTPVKSVTPTPDISDRGGVTFLTPLTLIEPLEEPSLPPPIVPPHSPNGPEMSPLPSHDPLHPSLADLDAAQQVLELLRAWCVTWSIHGGMDEVCAFVRQARALDPELSLPESLTRLRKLADAGFGAAQGVLAGIQKRPRGIVAKIAGELWPLRLDIWEATMRPLPRSSPVSQHRQNSHGYDESLDLRLQTHTPTDQF